MVSPHPNWVDAEDGYKNGSIGVFVHPAFIRAGDGVYSSSVGVPESDANAYSVSFRSGLGTGYGSHKSLVDFEDPRTAWEYANLATHFFEEAPTTEFAVSRLQGISDLMEDNWTPDGVVSDMGAEEVMRKMLGHYEFQLDDALAATDA
ncbi:MULTISPECIES: hypothetical protein [Natrinema]|uniref:Uncharacterized protein n=2 Tax=Natrinema TaxID=88723 RepID=M0CEF8_9EURY|nr:MULTISPECIES: hypothetical protein [Natrinema]ELZ21635.1 hypothetical protein C476_07906 [Natrinema limicola JCM 13563]SDD89302.1 hypothetical protein SAMN05192552_10664 [Natrinema hispanicum]